MYQVAYGMVSHHETAMDLTQEAFLRAYQNLGSFRGEAKFSTWLRRIVTNVCLDHLRKAEHRTVVSSYDETRGEGDDDPDGFRLTATLEAPDRAVARKELGRAIVEALRVLTPEQRAAIVLREVEGMSYEEMAKTMDCAVGTIMSRLHYARKRLRSMLTEHYDR
jgi:RNA polymerase sigma-70 factor (ECF subfamily)